MSEFDKQVTEAAQHAIVKMLASGDWLKVDWNSKLRIDTATLQEVYDAVDIKAVKKLLQHRIEDRVAEKIFHAMAEEIATDVKRILSNRELREDVRAVLRQKIRGAATPLTKDRRDAT